MNPSSIINYINPRRVSETVTDHERFHPCTVGNTNWLYISNLSTKLAGFSARPFILPRTMQVNRMAIRLAANPTSKFVQYGIYGVDMTPSMLTRFPYPGGLIVSSAKENFTSGVHEHTMSPAIVLPGGKILFAVTRQDTNSSWLIFDMEDTWPVGASNGWLLGVDGTAAASGSRCYHSWILPDSMGTPPWADSLPEYFPGAAVREYLQYEQGPIMGLRMVY